MTRKNCLFCFCSCVTANQMVCCNHSLFKRIPNWLFSGNASGTDPLYVLCNYRQRQCLTLNVVLSGLQGGSERADPKTRSKRWARLAMPLLGFSPPPCFGATPAPHRPRMELPPSPSHLDSSLSASGARA